MASADATRALLKTRHLYSDIYVGTPQQLCAAGLARLDQFPGQPGMPKVSATYFVADGIPVPHGCSCFERTYTVQRISASRFSVSVQVGEDEARRREPYLDANRDLPMDLPGTPVEEGQKSPPWAPEGWTFRRHRRHDDDYVFIATAEQLKTSGLMGQQALPALEDEARKTVHFLSARFDRVTVSQRVGSTFFVVLNTPSEIRYAEYSVSDYGHSVRHEGTKEQLQEKGLGVGLGFPGEAGCNDRKLTTLDPKTGNKVRIELLSSSKWRGEVPRFVVTVLRSEAEQEAAKNAKNRANAEKERLRRLKALPASPDQFRQEIARVFWIYTNAIKIQMQAKDGYRFTDEVVEEFTNAVSGAYWVIKNGRTMGRAPREQLKQVLSANAKADIPLQRFLSSFRPDAAH